MEVHVLFSLFFQPSGFHRAFNTSSLLLTTVITTATAKETTLTMLMPPGMRTQLHRVRLPHCGHGKQLYQHQCSETVIKAQLIY